MDPNIQFPRGLRRFFDAETFAGDRNRDDIAKLSTAPIQYVMPALSRHLVGAVWMASMAASYGSTDPADRTRFRVSQEVARNDSKGGVRPQ